MEIIRIIKNNRVLRGVLWHIRTYLGYSKRSFGYYGKDIDIMPPIYISNPKNVFLYGNNGLGDAIIYTTNARFVMKANSGAAFGLRVLTGNHARIVGMPYRCITEEIKPKGLDKDVVVESDVWIGMNVTLLAGVHIGRGATIAAGSIVTKDMPPYSVCAGIPAKPIKFYWTVDQILEHESRLYNEEERFSREELEKHRSSVGV